MPKYHKIIFCSFCEKSFYKYIGHVNESLKLGHNFFCSRKCLSNHRAKKKWLVCENCGKSFQRTPHEISRHNYCSQSCAAIANNKRYPKRKAKMGTCIKCGKSFKKRGKLRYCSIKCRRKAEWHTPEEVLGIIRNTVQRIGRIPARRELRGVDNACRRFFGSWNNAIVAAGFQPNRSHNQRMYKCANAKALDGHLCDSISELIIDDWFTKNKIFHKRNVPYPKTNHKADWAVLTGEEKIFIEYFGLANDSPRYDRAVRKKKSLCEKYKLRLIEIYPQDLYPKVHLDIKLRELKSLN